MNEGAPLPTVMQGLVRWLALRATPASAVTTPTSG